MIKVSYNEPTHGLRTKGKLTRRELRKKAMIQRLIMSTIMLLACALCAMYFKANGNGEGLGLCVICALIGIANVFADRY